MIVLEVYLVFMILEWLVVIFVLMFVFMFMWDFWVFVMEILCVNVNFELIEVCVFFCFDIVKSLRNFYIIYIFFDYIIMYNL